MPEHSNTTPSRAVEDFLASLNGERRSAAIRTFAAIGRAIGVRCRSAVHVSRATRAWIAAQQDAWNARRVVLEKFASYLKRGITDRRSFERK